MTHVLFPSVSAGVQSDLPSLSLDLPPLFSESDALFAAQSSLLLSPILSTTPTFSDSMFNSAVMPLNRTSSAALDSLPPASQSYTTDNTNTSSNASHASNASTAVVNSPVSDHSSSPPPRPSKPKPKRASPPSHSAAAKAAKVLSPIEKAAERRRKNRESSSRCYYNRKRIIQSLEKQLLAEKQKLTSLYDKALQLRHDNARLKKDVVTNGYALPCFRTSRAYNNSNAFSLRDYLRLLHHSTYQNASQALM
ncbi:hypothetical protein FGB62_130g153 [Gracilaria domingensis]|nr:hypothetical protein FGB62_130g153 [Gracilaria domingensis]